MLDSFRYGWATVLLGPIFIAQGKYVRRRTEILPEPEGDRQGRIGRGNVLNVLIVGDSAGAGVGCDTQEQALLGQIVAQLAQNHEVHYRLEANTGDTTSQCIERLKRLDHEPFDVVVTSLGVNDVTSPSSARRFKQRQTELIALLRERFAAQQIIVSGLPPMGHFPALPQPLRWFLGERAKQFDQIIEAIASRDGTDYIKFEFDGDTSVMARDGFHPGPQVYSAWATLVVEKIAQR